MNREEKDLRGQVSLSSADDGVMMMMMISLVLVLGHHDPTSDRQKMDNHI